MNAALLLVRRGMAVRGIFGGAPLCFGPHGHSATSSRPTPTASSNVTSMIGLLATIEKGETERERER